jgi:mRNA-degrading endonuclease RelE of RelBE toxin-antitoxin system
MSWAVTLKESVIDDMRWFGRKDGRVLLDEADRRLSANPLAETGSMKTLRPNPFAQRDLRLFGKYRVLFNVDRESREVTVVMAGEKRGNSLFVRGREFTAHHESHPPE